MPTWIRRLAPWNLSKRMSKRWLERNQPQAKPGRVVRDCNDLKGQTK